MALPRIVITSGEPAGIGPDLCIALAQKSWPCELVIVGDRRMLGARARQLGIALELKEYVSEEHVAHVPNTLQVAHIPTVVAVQPGKLETQNSASVLEILSMAVDGCLRGEFAAMVTAPVQKSVINDAGIAFTGHTEYLAARCGKQLPVMMLVAGSLRVALATTHLPLHAVSQAITAELLEQVIVVLQDDLRTKFGIAKPRLLICGLNPHAGEGGHLGREEIEVISPTLERLRSRGLQLIGPAPADTAFTPRMLQQADAVLAMYHDQGLPVLKYSGFGEAVNITLGLPIIRTSVDHGTALDLVGSGRADGGSLEAALELAIQLAQTKL